jgi:hypothetical protein
VVRVVTVDLARLEKVAGEVGEVICPQEPDRDRPALEIIRA